MYINTCLYTSILTSIMYVTLNYLGIDNFSVIFFLKHFMLVLVLHSEDIKNVEGLQIALLLWILLAVGITERKLLN